MPSETKHGITTRINKKKTQSLCANGLKEKKAFFWHTKITIQTKFQNHIYGHNLADDKIKTNRWAKNTQTWQMTVWSMYNFERYIHTIFIWISYIYPFVIIETSELKSMRSAKHVVNIISVTLGCIKLPYDSILMYK